MYAAHDLYITVREHVITMGTPRMGPINTRHPATAARAYQALGWPLVIGHRHRPRGGCTCGNPQCPTPGAHPRPGRLTPLGEQQLLEQLDTQPGAALIATTAAIDAVVLPRVCGMAAMASLDRIAPVPCLTEGERAILLVLPATGRYALAEQHPAVQVRGGPEQWIPLPPTHGTRWDTPPWNEQTHQPVALLHGGDLKPHLAAALAQAGGRP